MSHCDTTKQHTAAHNVLTTFTTVCLQQDLGERAIALHGMYESLLSQIE
jgi:hypothetical protein